MEGPQIELRLTGGKSAFLQGPENLLVLTRKLLKEKDYKNWSSVKENLLIPKEASKVQEKEDEILSTVGGLRDDIMTLQEAINEAVEELYGLFRVESQ